MAKKLYVVKRTVWHTADNVYYFPAAEGEPPTLVNLEHMTQEWIDELIKRGVYEEHKPGGAKAEAERGADDDGG